MKMAVIAAIDMNNRDFDKIKVFDFYNLDFLPDFSNYRFKRLVDAKDIDKGIEKIKADVEELKKEKLLYGARNISEKDYDNEELRGIFKYANDILKERLTDVSRYKEINQSFLRRGCIFCGKPDYEKVVNLINMHNRTFFSSKENEVLSFLLITRVAGGHFVAPSSYPYLMVYRRVVELTPLEYINRRAMKVVIPFEEKDREFYFDGNKKIDRSSEAVLLLEDDGRIYIDSLKSMGTEANEIRAGFIGDIGVAVDYMDRFYEYVTFKEGEEIVKNKVFDNFETVDRYSIKKRKKQSNSPKM